MRISFFLLFVCVFQLIAGPTNAQESILNVSKSALSIGELIGAIEDQTDYLFVYSDFEIDVKQEVTVKHKSGKVADFLSDAFASTDIRHEFENNYIVLTKNGIIASKQASLQQAGKKMITGVITDHNGETIIGANILEKGTSNGNLTDLDGKFTLSISENAIIVISYIGYLTQEVKTSNQSNYNIVMQENTKMLDEVVVIGYGTTKRINVSGAISTTDSKTFESRPVQNAASALQGEMPGLTVIRTGGAPGSAPTIRVRDVSSVNGGSPLILIDGAEGDLNLINPTDIENISVLKDGTAAIYGARAADGVILVTTKSARRNQKLKISFDSYYSVKTPALLKRPANLYEHAAMGLEITDGSFPLEYTQEELQMILDGSNEVQPTSNWGRWSGYPKFYKDQDYNKLVIGNGNLQNYNVNLSGGGEKYSYLISLGFQNENGLPKFGTDNDKKYFVRSKSNIEIVKNLNYDLNLSYEAGSRNYSSGIEHGQNVWELIYKTRSWAPLRNPAGNFYTFEGFDNPAQLLEDGGVSNRTTGNFTINNQLSWQIIDGLTLIGRAVIRKSDFDQNIIQKKLYSYNWDNVNHRVGRPTNSVDRIYGKTLSKNFTLYAEYKKTFNELHNVGVMVGAANESANYDRFTARRINFDQQETMSLPLGSSENQSATSEGNAWTINSGFSRLNYSFADRYFIEGTLRADGSSRFDPDYRWGYFPGVNGAWRISEEKFIKDLNIFDNLKVRASYGEMGNQSGIGLYDYIQLVSISTDYYPFGEGQKGQMASPGNIVSTSRTWETVSTTDIGVDINVLQDRLFGSFDYFWKTNKNMLIPVTYPSMLGASAPSTNSGRLNVKGWEISLGWRDKVGDFNYSVRGVLSDAQNEVAEIGGSNLITLGRNNTPKNYPMSSYFGYLFDGIIQTEQELADYKTRFPQGGIPGDLTVGDAKYKDLDGDGKLSVLGDGKDYKGDVKYLGNTNPRYSFGLNLNADFKGFDFGAFIQGVGERTMFLEGEADKPFAQPWFQSASYWYGKTWTKDRTDAKYPAITGKGKRGYNYYVSSNTKHNVAYVRLKNLQLGYTLPKQLVQTVKLEKVRVYFSGEDLFEIHNAPGGWDPEEGGAYTYYPFARNYSLGINLVF